MKRDGRVLALSSTHFSTARLHFRLLNSIQSTLCVCKTQLIGWWWWQWGQCKAEIFASKRQSVFQISPVSSDRPVALYHRIHKLPWGKKKWKADDEHHRLISTISWQLSPSGNASLLFTQSNFMRFDSAGKLFHAEKFTVNLRGRYLFSFQSRRIKILLGS